jgi:hypothetical protein
MFLKQRNNFTADMSMKTYFSKNHARNKIITCTNINLYAFSASHYNDRSVQRKVSSKFFEDILHSHLKRATAEPRLCMTS